MPEVKKKVEVRSETSDDVCNVSHQVDLKTFDQETKVVESGAINRNSLDNDLDAAKKCSERSVVNSRLGLVPASDNLSTYTNFSASCIGKKLDGDDSNKLQLVEYQRNSDEGTVVEWLPSKISQPRGRRSCEMTNTFLPCIRKVTNQLHKLQDIINKLENDWSQRESTAKERQFTSMSESLNLKKVEELTEGEVTHDKMSSAGRSQGSSYGRKLLWSFSSASLMTTAEEFEPDVNVGSRQESSARGAVLEVRGESAGKPLSRASTLSKPSTAKPKSKGEMAECYAVIGGVLSLLNRMEKDCLATEQALQKERFRVLNLHDEIDKLAYQRMHDLPAAVQREHEVCAININELRWHCAYRSRVETRISEKVRQAEIRNAKLKHDLSNIQKHCPLVEEKLDLEGEAMTSIQDKQDETDNELLLTLERLAATERKTAEANNKATQERLLIKQDVDVVRNELNAVSDELAQLKMYFTSNTHTLNDLRSELSDKNEEAARLNEREKRIKNMQNTLMEKVQSMEEKIALQKAEYKRLKHENIMLMKDKESMKGTLENELHQMKSQLKNSEDRSGDLERRNKNLKNNIRALEKKLEIKAKQRVADEKAVIRANQEVMKVEEQLKVSLEETKKVEVIHSSLEATLSSERDQIMKVEESLRTNALAIEKNLRDEAHARHVLQAKIKSDSSEMKRILDESKAKREKATQRVEEIKRLVKHVREQVSKLEKIHQERKQNISELDILIEKLNQQHQEMESDLRGKIEERLPKEAQLRKENLQLDESIEQMSWKCEMIEKKRQDMDSSERVMSKSVTATKEKIDVLSEDLSELKIQLESASETERDLKALLEHNEARNEKRRKEHETFMDARRSALKTNQKGVEEALRENKRLASEYKSLEETYLREKSSFLQVLEKRVNEEGSVKDHRELKALQDRMREVLQYYYKIRSLQNQAELEELEFRTAANGEKLSSLQSEMMRVIDHINRFLEANNTAHGTISAEAAKIAQSPLTLMA